IRKPVAESNVRMLMPVQRRIAPLVSQFSRVSCDPLVGSYQHAAFTGRDLLVWIKREQSSITKCPHLPPTHLASQRLTSIFDQMNCVARTCPERSRMGPRPRFPKGKAVPEFVHFCRNAKRVYGQDQLSAICNRGRYQFRGRVVSLRIEIDKDRTQSLLQH